ncbi:hypothetical protein KKF34_06865 [Myxococcota bacterium]|nr:hypothetical protein [Myxococcota bacterium]MBU1382423.1 hypothetical protein [Myxococcota bacterium]MBU1496582.1 hypothetical protein [Myxococcota bacterium]
MTKLHNSLILLIFISFSGCALMVKGTKEPIQFESSIAETEVFINGVYKGKTPLKLKLKSSVKQIVEFRKNGFKPQVFTIGTYVNRPYLFFDIFFIAFGALFIDATTGAYYSLDAKYIKVQMPPES